MLILKVELRIAFTMEFQLNRKKKAIVIARFQNGPQGYCLLVCMTGIIPSHTE